MSRINPATALYQASPSTPRFTPQPDALLYKDLLIFEERLKQNVRRLKRKKQKYQGKVRWYLVQLVLLFLMFIGFSWKVWSEPNTTAWSTLYKALAFGCIIVLYGIYRSRTYTQTTKFIPQCNRSLFAYNMNLAIDGNSRDGRLEFSDRVPALFNEGLQAFKALYYQRKRAAATAGTHRSTADASVSS